MILAKCARLESQGGSVVLGGPGQPGALSAGTEYPEPDQSREDASTAAVPPFSLKAPALRPDGTLAVSLEVVPGQRYQLYRSTDLVTWVLWHDFTADAEVFELTDVEAPSAPMRFFKVLVP
jgi:hypothetical protein